MVNPTPPSFRRTHGSDLLDTPVLDALCRFPGDAWQQFTVLLPAERQVTTGLRRHGGQEDRLMEDGPQTGL